LLVTQQQHAFNPLTSALKPHSNGSLHITLAVDGWAVTSGTAKRGLDEAAAGTGSSAPPSPLLAVPNVTAHPSTASVPIMLFYVVLLLPVPIKGLKLQT